MFIKKKTVKEVLGLSFSSQLEKILEEISHLILRVGFSVLIMTHGWGKLVHYSEKVDRFPDPIGLGSQYSLILAIGAEFFAGLLLMLGLLTRLSALGLVITMSVIVFIFHGADPLKAKELGLLYGLAFLALLLSGGKKWSLDHFLRTRFFKS